MKILHIFLIFSMSWSCIIAMTENQSSKPVSTFTLLDYMKMNRDEKIQWQAESSAIKAHPLNDLRACNVVDSLADAIRKQYTSEKTIFGLGQSPAYILEAAKTKEHLEGKDTSRFAGLLAFSGSWFTPYQGSLTQSSQPEPEQIEAYQQYLRSMQFTPSDIVADKQHNNKKTVVVDYVEQARGLTSFLSLVNAWAQKEGNEKELKQSLTIHGFQNPNQKQWNSIEGYQITSHTPYSLNDNTVVQKLANMDRMDDRLVMQYKSQDWGKKDPHTFVPSRTADLMKFRVFDYVTTNQQRKELAIAFSQATKNPGNLLKDSFKSNKGLSVIKK